MITRDGHNNKRFQAHAYSNMLIPNHTIHLVRTAYNCNSVCTSNQVTLQSKVVPIPLSCWLPHRVSYLFRWY